ncbi:hypothetical protein AGDE_13323 [Angomonas deanei]|uniref:Uncharacterized protein n=1 Tax=Angomonas deanei TaxID=59799 RepID=A0A7G2CFE5_9TRYP|nr:hypothetical protein AGDE_13323 [Angomonas deanei]CAD2218259.1 hypothetical protein, conserved [Angomonas deanei]|eukprot:EPY22457.1 hypothetical protein AGDE_13323 [Angomonas deanei]
MVDFVKRCDAALERAKKAIEKSEAQTEHFSQLEEEQSARRKSVSPGAVSPLPRESWSTRLASPFRAVLSRTRSPLPPSVRVDRPSSSPRRESSKTVRKSVRFAEEVEDEEEDSKRPRLEDSIVLPPAPPPSEVSAAEPSITAEEHREMVVFIKENNVKKCLSAYKKDDLIHFLRGEGVREVDESLPKKKLLEEAKALVS